MIGPLALFPLSREFWANSNKKILNCLCGYMSSIIFKIALYKMDKAADGSIVAK